MTRHDIIGRPSGRLACFNSVVVGAALFAFGQDLAHAGGWGVALAGALAVAFVGAVYRQFRGRPGFVVTDEGLQFPGVRGVIRWAEIASIERAGWDVESLRLQVVVRDQRALVSRTTAAYRPLALLYRAVSLLPRLTAMYWSWSPLPLDELAEEIDRRAGAPLVAPPRPSALSQLLRNLVHAGERAGRS